LLTTKFFEKYFSLLETLLTFIGYFSIGYNNKIKIILIAKKKSKRFCTHIFNVSFVVICYIKNMVKKSLLIYLFKVFSGLVQLYMVGRVFYSLLKVYLEAHLFMPLLM
jgi:hypothetical protein